MRVLLTLLAWIVAVVVAAPLCFFGVMLLAGPHSSMLPSFLQSVVVVLGWAALLVVPILAARFVWRRGAPRERP